MLIATCTEWTVLGRSQSPIIHFGSHLVPGKRISFNNWGDFVRIRGLWWSLSTCRASPPPGALHLCIVFKVGNVCASHMPDQVSLCRKYFLSDLYGTETPGSRTISVWYAWRIWNVCQGPQSARMNILQGSSYSSNYCIEQDFLCSPVLHQWCILVGVYLMLLANLLWVNSVRCFATVGQCTDLATTSSAFKLWSISRHSATDSFICIQKQGAQTSIMHNKNIQKLALLHTAWRQNWAIFHTWYYKGRLSRISGGHDSTKIFFAATRNYSSRGALLIECKESRIGKQPVVVPQAITVDIKSDSITCKASALPLKSFKLAHLSSAISPHLSEHLELIKLE